MAVLRSHRRRRRLAVLLLAAVLCRFTPAPAQDGQPLQLYEEKIKAGLIYNFLKYTTWPAAARAHGSGSLQVCLLGEDSLDDDLFPLEGRTAQQYTIAVKRVASATAAEGCSLLFVHRDQAGNMPALVQSLRGKHVLTISDIDDFAAQGGMIEFAKENQQIGLLVNKPALDYAGFSVQARLLKLARLIVSH